MAGSYRGLHQGHAKQFVLQFVDYDGPSGPPRAAVETGNTNGSNATTPAINDAMFVGTLNPAAYGSAGSLGFLLGSFTYTVFAAGATGSDI